MLYNINKQMRRKTHTHTPSELISDLICCALQVHLFLILKIKGKCNGGDWWVILVIRDPGFFFPKDFCWFSCAVNHDKDSVCEFILHSSWYTPHVYVFVNLLVQCGLLCLFVLFFFSTRCCQYYTNYWTHPPFNCWQNRPD